MIETEIDGFINMRRDSELLYRAEQGLAGFRVYTWDGLWVSLGMNQCADDALIDSKATRWVSRPTGGSAVIHGHDVTVGLALPLDRSSVRHTYRYATEPLVQALNEAGVAAVLAEDLNADRVDLALADCFASVSRNDIVDPCTRIKVCGCALKRTRSAVLVQASIPAGEPLAPPWRVVKGGVPTAASAIEAEALFHALAKRIG